MTQAEHLSWCKQRAHEYLDAGDWHAALMSMCSDLRKTPPGVQPYMHIGMLMRTVHDLESARKFIDGWN